MENLRSNSKDKTKPFRIINILKMIRLVSPKLISFLFEPQCYASLCTRNVLKLKCLVSDAKLSLRSTILCVNLNRTRNSSLFGRSDLKPRALLPMATVYVCGSVWKITLKISTPWDITIRSSTHGSKNNSSILGKRRITRWWWILFFQTFAQWYGITLHEIAFFCVTLISLSTFKGRDALLQSTLESPKRILYSGESD